MGEEKALVEFLTLSDVLRKMDELIKHVRETEKNSELTKNKLYRVPGNEELCGGQKDSPHRNVAQEIDARLDEIGMISSRTNNNIGDINQLIGE